MLRLTDRSDMTIAVYRGSKAKKPKKTMYLCCLQIQLFSFGVLSWLIHVLTVPKKEIVEFENSVDHEETAHNRHLI